MRPTERRQFLGLLATSGLLAVAGCSSTAAPADEGAKEDADVVVGPGGSMRFDPEEFTVSAGETVTWYFESGGHNVSCRPEHADQVQLPDGAEPFASIDGDASRRATNDPGETYSHTFDVPGRYEYVCVPHVAFEMFASVVVEE